MDLIDLGDRLEAFVADLVSKGRYKDRISVLRQSVILLEERERKLADLDARIEAGLADVRAGRVKSADEVFNWLEQRLSAKLGSR